MPIPYGSSNALDCKSNIVSMIRGIPEATSEKWDIDWGFARTPERVWVYCGEVSWDESAWVTNRQREETFRVRVVVNIKRRRGTPEDAERDAMRVAGLVEGLVKTTPNLNDSAITLAEWVPKRMDCWPSDEFTEAQIEADIRVTARF